MSTVSPPVRMNHREILESLSGLLLVLFVAMISSTIVSTALPRIVGELNGDHAAIQCRPARHRARARAGQGLTSVVTQLVRLGRWPVVVAP
ncbi:hypothetical protein [Catellatospora sichuanensis]|uniref:hypothetical protein n=1 Tax=Catellatospora sichuanensis TaxID=1969805 RepID=UPI00164351A0|nr:hypothetical protein [Catellatospora sichuanensis]